MNPARIAVNSFWTGTTSGTTALREERSIAVKPPWIAARYQGVLRFESRVLVAPPPNSQPQVYRRSVTLAAEWAPIRETAMVNLAGYIGHHPAGQQYTGYWPQSEIQQADQG